MTIRPDDTVSVAFRMAECGMLTGRAHLWYTLPPGVDWVP